MSKMSIASVVLAALPAVTSAEIIAFTVTSSRPYGDFLAGKYVLIEGEARGVLSPTEGIPGLDKAPRNAAGLVEYRTPEDAVVIVHAAAENPAFTPTRPRARGATSGGATR